MSYRYDQRVNVTNGAFPLRAAAAAAAVAAALAIEEKKTSWVSYKRERESRSGGAGRGANKLTLPLGDKPGGIKRSFPPPSAIKQRF